MKPYYEFYSDLNLILQAIESLKEKCHTWWIEDEPYSEKDQDSKQWYYLENELDTIYDTLNNEPFFNNEDDNR